MLESGWKLGPASAEIDREVIGHRWGIHWGPWLWATRIRILFVIDGRITDGWDPSEFGLGPAIGALRAQWFVWWVRFTVDVVDRDLGFRFTNADFDIDAYDQVWFFGDEPGTDANVPVPDSVIVEPQYGPMTDDELKIIAEWMNRGGGVFATGDHSLLGASMCHRIPRVRTMRRWTHAQGVPSVDGEERHQTLVDVDGVLADDEEGDRWPQRIYPVPRHDSDWPFIYGSGPHPILCGRDGVIDHFPDHMHEGGLFEDDDVVVTAPIGIPGMSGDEYPVLPNGARPRPQLIARGMTALRGRTPKSFGMVGAYDGDPVGVGRVVVDSTWHHWFSMNLAGFNDDASSYYYGMQQYFRNIGMWLATPTQRANMLFAATWGGVIGVHPGAYSPSFGVVGLGRRVVDVIGRSAPQCILSELVATFLRAGEAHKEFGTELPWEAALRPHPAMVNEAIMGGITLGMLEFAQHHQNELAHGRATDVSLDEVVARGLEGVAIGIKELQDALQAASSRFRALAEEPFGERYAALARALTEESAAAQRSTA